MKRSMSILFVIVMAGVLLLSGCNQIESSNNSAIIGSSLIKYDLQGISDFGFNVNFISPTKNNDIKFVSFFGENAQGLSVRLTDDTYDEIKSMKYNGYYVTLLGFVCKTGDSYVQIDGVTLNINGIDQSFEFATPIKHQVKKDTLETSVQAGNYPLFISSNSYSTTEYSFEYYVDNDVTIEKFDFNDFIKIKSCVISVNGEDIGDLSSLPISMKKGSNVTFRCYLDFRDCTTTSDCDSIYCDSMLFYKTVGSNDIAILYNNLVSQSVSNEDDAKRVIDLLSSKSHN